MNKIEISKESVNKYPKLRNNCNTAKMCWFNVGSTTNWCYKPSSVKELQNFITEFTDHIDIQVIGAGSNVIFTDHNISGIIIRLGKEFNYINEKNKNNINSDTRILTVGAATLDFNLALYSRDNKISGLEFFTGIPGTIGGAIAMNAGAYGTETKDILMSFKAINIKTAEIRIFNTEDIDFDYRYNPLNPNWIYLEGTFLAKPGNQKEIASKIKQIQQEREQTQPVKTKTGGSTFKNPIGQKAWKLIDEAGCRGLRVGGCHISNLHCNFIVNDNNASASDIIQLIKIVQNKVYENSGVMLEPEIKIVGDC